MKKIYLLIYNSGLGTRDEIKAILDALPQVISWRYDLPNAFFIVSESNAKELAEVIRARALEISIDREKGMFLIVDITDSDNIDSLYGWLAQESWFFMFDHMLKNQEKLNG